MMAEFDIEQKDDLLDPTLASDGEQKVDFYDANAVINAQNLNRTVLLDSYGINLSYSEVGRSEDFPLLLFLGVDSHRYVIILLEKFAILYNLRLICIDRPGRGMSGDLESDSNRILQWPGIVEEFCLKMKIEKFYLLGQSLGAVFALYTAHILRDRVVGSVHLVAPWTSLESSEASSFLRSTRYFPTFVVTGFINATRFIAKGVSSCISTPKLLQSISSRCSDAEREMVLQHKAAVCFEAINLAQANGEQSNGIVLDMLAAIENTHPFPFQYSEINVPVEVYHGNADDMVPLELVREMCAALQNCRLSVRENGTHALLMDDVIIKNVFEKIRNDIQSARNSCVEG